MEDIQAAATLVLNHMIHHKNTACVVALVAFGDPLTCKDLMIEPLFTQARDEGLEPQYDRGHHVLMLNNGARAFFLPGSQPDRLRGLNLTKAWVLEGVSHRVKPEVVHETLTNLRICLMRAEDQEPIRTILVSVPPVTNWQALGDSKEAEDA